MKTFAFAPEPDGMIAQIWSSASVSKVERKAAMSNDSKARSSKRARGHLDSAFGRIFAVMGGAFLLLYIARYAQHRRPDIDFLFIAEIALPTILIPLIYWPLIYLRSNFPYIYRYFVLRSRKYNIYLFCFFIFPVMLIGQLVWIFIIFVRYPGIIEDFFYSGNPRPIFGVLAGPPLAFLSIVAGRCMVIARKRGIAL